MKAYANWDVPGAPARTSAEMVQALDRTWQCMTGTTAASSRSPSACTGSRRISPASACERLDMQRWEHAALSTIRKPSPSDGSSEEWSVVAPSFAWLPEEVSQRKYDLCEVAERAALSREDRSPLAQVATGSATAFSRGVNDSG